MTPVEIPSTSNQKTLTFPRHCPLQRRDSLFYRSLHGTEIHSAAALMTRHTLEIGARYSPDTVCTPFKSTLGCMIEALDSGADTLMMSHGLCRLGYYGGLQEQILRDLGYEFDFINLAAYSTGKKKDLLKVLKRINPKVKYTRYHPWSNGCAQAAGIH